MAGPWDQYQSDAPNDGPWSQYQAPSPSKSAAAPLTRTDRYLKGLRDPIDAGAQLLTNMLPDSVVNAGNQLNNFIADKTGLVGRLPEGGVDQQVRQAEKEYQGRRTAGGESGLDAYRLAGNVINPANLAVASRLPAAATLAGRVGVGALGGAISGGLTPVAEGDFASEKAKQVGAGALVGGAIPAVAGGVARVISPNASKNVNLQLLRKEGVTPTIGQALGGLPNRVEEKFVSAPILGDAIRSGRNRADTEFQAAAINRSLTPIGESLPKGAAGRDAIAYAENALKQKYDDVLTGIGAIPTDQQFSSKVTNLGKLVNRDVLSKEAKKKFTTILSDVKGAFDNNGVLTSEGYKRVESQLGSDFRKLTSSQDIYDGRLAPAVKQLQEELRDLLRRQAGSHADDLKAVNSGWANFKRVQNAASKLGADEGQFTPAQFQNAVRALDKSKDKGAFARGSALGQDLGDAGKSVLTNKIPNSGTADRLMNAGAIGSWLVNPAIPLTALGASGAYLPPVQRALVGAVASRPGAAQPTADLLRQISPLALGASGQLGVGLLGD